MTESKDYTKEHSTTIDKGLTKEVALKRLNENGLNKFESQKKESMFKKILHSLTDFTTIVLLIAASVSFYTAIATSHGDLFEGILIIAIVIINSVLAIIQEGNAEKALSALEDMNKQVAQVIRDGQLIEIDAEEVVLGDILALENGSMIAADAHLLTATQLRVEESALTGESEPVEKDANYQPTENEHIGDKLNIIYKGSTIVNGRGRAVVTATGMDTEMGKIASMINNTPTRATPLQNRLNQLGKRISLVALVAALIVFIIGYAQGEDILDIFMTAVSLAVAAVPETLMVIVTLALAFGVQKMAKKNAIIRRLPAVETLGSANVICSDKTGTLTQNKMLVRRAWRHGDEVVDVEDSMTDEMMDMLKIAALCCDVVLDNSHGDNQYIGNPTEIAIVRAVEDNYHSYLQLKKDSPRVGELPFDSNRKMMTTVHKQGKHYIAVTKGAFDVLLPRFKYGNVQQAAIVNDRFGKKALRVLAVGYRIFDELPEISSENLEHDIHLVGLIGIIDPPRPESKQAIARAKKAGIKTVMITGDHIVTANAIAKELEILEDNDRSITGAQLQQLSDEELDAIVEKTSVYARVTPEDKIRIVQSWQRQGATVAMTGDGVNDAPALNASDVGCAMGIAGTDVAKGAADIILTDDNFATIVDAVKQGRIVYQNIRKTVNFLLSCNLSEIFIVLIAMLLGWGAPFTAAQLLFVNVVADGLPGFALGKEPAEDGIMDASPISQDKSIFADGLWKKILINVLLFTVVTLLGYYLSAFVDSISPWVNASDEIGQTVAFLILGYSSILHIFNVRSQKSIFKVDLATNKSMFEMAILAIVLTTIIALVPFTQDLFNLVPISLNHWLLAGALSIVPVFVNEMIKFHQLPESEE